jgi:deoxyribodipyrimidine photo-lyase
MACVDVTVGELERDGWLVNQTRMWLASQWTVRAGHPWTAGEDRFFVHLLDGSRAANRLGWQWAVGAGTGKPYGFSRWQVRKRAPGLCERCACATPAPSRTGPRRGPARGSSPRGAAPRPRSGGVGRPGAVAAAGGAAPEAVWLTAESLGDADPALAARPTCPRSSSSTRRCSRAGACRASAWSSWPRRSATWPSAGPSRSTAARRRGARGRPLAATFAPVPGFRARAARLQVAELHPWPWLVRPHGGPAGSFSAWRKAARR